MKFWEYTTDSDHFFTLVLADFERDKWILPRDFQPGLIEAVPESGIQVIWEATYLSPSQRVLLRKGKLPRPDFPSLYGLHIVFNERALDALWPLIQNKVQVIPLQCEGERLFLIHIMKYVDGLDLERSEVRWLVENKAISRIWHHVFYEEKLKEENIFKMPLLISSIFVSDAFKEAVEEHGLTGLLWKPLP